VAKVAGKTVMHWVVAAIIGVAIALWLGLFAYHGGLSITMNVTGFFATVGVVFLSSIGLGFLIKAIGK
jgi:hypothetical protein